MANADPPTLEPVPPEDAEEIEAMARSIWPLVYSEIISDAQIEYMLNWMYSPDRIRSEIEKHGFSYFWIISEGERAGFLAGGPQEGKYGYELHKIYLHPDYHGRGIAGSSLDSLFAHVREQGRNQIHLRVNRENERAIAFYKKHGFVVEGKDKAAIGSGYFMDDFVLSRSL